MTDIGGLLYELLAADAGGFEARVVGRGPRPPTDVVIPATVTLEARQLPVTEVALTAFVSASFTSVQFPTTLRAIRGAAFEKNSKLRSVTFPADGQLTAIDEAAFQDCTSIEKISLPPSLQTLNCWAFKDCTRLREVELPADGSLELIDDSCFEGCDLLSIAIPRAVKTIADRAFRANKNLCDVTFGNDSQLVTVGCGVFSETGIERIRIPPNVNNIGSWTFLGAGQLHTIEFAGGVGQPIVHFGAWIFEGTQVAQIIIPASLHTIECGAFQGVSTLQEVIVPPDSALIRIGPRGFMGARFAHIRLPASFFQCELEAFCDCAELAEFDLPVDSKLRFVPRGAFKGCRTLARVVIPSVTQLSEEAFVGCIKLRSARFALPGQTKEQRNRKIRIAEDLFRDLRVFVVYPEATLKVARDVLKECPEDFE